MLRRVTFSGLDEQWREGCRRHARRCHLFMKHPFEGKYLMLLGDTFFMINSVSAGAGFPVDTRCHLFQGSSRVR